MADAWITVKLKWVEIQLTVIFMCMSQHVHWKTLRQKLFSEQGDYADVRRFVCIGQLPRYESYKDSGVQWLGKSLAIGLLVRLDQGCEIVRGNTGFSKADLLEGGQYVALQYGKTYKVDEINNTFSSYVNEEFL